LSNDFSEDVMTIDATLSRVAALCLLAGAAHASPAPAADGRTPVPATVYSAILPYRAAATEPASPDRAWREQNRIVGAANSMMPAPDGHGAHGTHAADPHAGHRMPGAHAADGKAAPMPGGPDAPQACGPALPAPNSAPPPAPHRHEGQP
jgi:hypothetical protein